MQDNVKFTYKSLIETKSAIFSSFISILNRINSKIAEGKYFLT
jgi:hypothetical protein